MGMQVKRPSQGLSSSASPMQRLCFLQKKALNDGNPPFGISTPFMEMAFALRKKGMKIMEALLSIKKPQSLEMLGEISTLNKILPGTV